MSITPIICDAAVRQAATFLLDPTTAIHRPLYGRQKLLVPPIRGSQSGLVGTGFDYFARAYLARRARASGSTLHERRWIAEIGSSLLPKNSEAHERCADLIAAAREEWVSYVSGGGCNRRLAGHCQQLANLDLLYRAPAYFRPDFKTIPTVSEQITLLAEVLDQNAGLFSGHALVMNPSFPAAKSLGGADGDIVIDRRLIDFKTTKNHLVRRESLLQVAIYAALQKLGGHECGEHKSHAQFETIELYFARYGELVVWETAAVFRAAAFKKFVRAVAEARARIGRILNPHPSSTPR